MTSSPRALAALVLTAALATTWPASLDAQPTAGDLDAMASWVAVDAATGYERRAAVALAAALPGWRADAWGNVLTTVGTGSPHHVVACALDRPSYAISQITDDGYLRAAPDWSRVSPPVVGPAVRGPAGARADRRAVRSPVSSPAATGTSRRSIVVTSSRRPTTSGWMWAPSRVQTWKRSASHCSIRSRAICRPGPLPAPWLVRMRVAASGVRPSSRSPPRRRALASHMDARPSC